jgi:hypothetical protein
VVLSKSSAQGQSGNPQRAMNENWPPCSWLMPQASSSPFTGNARQNKPQRHADRSTAGCRSCNPSHRSTEAAANTSHQQIVTSARPLSHCVGQAYEALAGAGLNGQLNTINQTDMSTCLHLHVCELPDSPVRHAQGSDVMREARAKAGPSCTCAHPASS